VVGSWVGVVVVFGGIFVCWGFFGFEGSVVFGCVRGMAVLLGVLKQIPLCSRARCILLQRAWRRTRWGQDCKAPPFKSKCGADLPDPGKMGSHGSHQYIKIASLNLSGLSVKGS